MCRNSESGVFEVPVRNYTPPCLIGNEVSGAPGVQNFTRAGVCEVPVHSYTPPFLIENKVSGATGA